MPWDGRVLDVKPLDLRYFWFSHVTRYQRWCSPSNDTQTQCLLFEVNVKWLNNFQLITLPLSRLKTYCYFIAAICSINNHKHKIKFFLSNALKVSQIYTPIKKFNKNSELRYLQININSCQGFLDTRNSDYICYEQCTHNHYVVWEG